MTVEQFSDHREEQRRLELQVKSALTLHKQCERLAATALDITNRSTMDTSTVVQLIITYELVLVLHQRIKKTLEMLDEMDEEVAR